MGPIGGPRGSRRKKGGVFQLVRTRIAVDEDGEVLAVLGAEIVGPDGLAVEVRREGMTAEAWAMGIWLRLP